MNAIRRALDLYTDFGLDIEIVSYGRSKPCVQQLTSEFVQPNGDRTIR